jgi:hypothetical protein
MRGKLILQQRVNRQNQRLDHVVKQMGNANRTKDAKGGAP